jgi:N4-gp56 family major capsid protein
MMAQVAQTAFFMRIASKEDSSAIQILDDLQKHAGDQVTFGISQLLQGAGVLNLQTLTGNEEAPITYSDALTVSELAHAVLLVGPISNQRVLFDRRKIGRNRLADWYAARVDHGAANQLGSYTPQTNVNYTGLQSPVAITRQILPSGITDAANLTSTNTFQITYWDTFVRSAKALTSGIRPVKVGGKQLFIGVMHPSQTTDMRQNTSTGQWLDIEKAAMTGGDVGDNPIFWESLGMYRGVLLHENSRVTNSVSNAGAAVANTKRALGLGAQAAVLAFGRGFETPIPTAAIISSPVPNVVVYIGFRSSCRSSASPLAAAISMIAVFPSPRIPNRASTFISGSGPVTRRVTNFPPVAVTSASTVPSPPSAIGQ